MDIQVFNNEQFGALRTYEEDGQVLFCGKDVAKSLGYKNPNKAIGDHCRGITKRYPIQDSLGRTQEAVFISEPDLYRLITHSKLPTAERFERWVFEEVLPAIRRTGGYMVAKQDETPEQIMARAVLVAQDTIERQKKQIDELKPKALFADAVAASDGTCLVGELAKMLKQNGVNIGQNRLFSWLRENGYLGKTGSNRNVPTQRSMEQGLFRIKETAVTHSDGHVTINRTPKVTGKGQRYFIEAFAKRGDLVG